jgi:S-disulfanyl-L-cysteine oxidoreductase SoxD
MPTANNADINSPRAIIQYDRRLRGIVAICAYTSLLSTRNACIVTAAAWVNQTRRRELSFAAMPLWNFEMSRKRTRGSHLSALGLLGVAGAIVAAIWIAILWSSSASLRIEPTDSRTVDQGRRLYAEACASCHGANLEGQSNWRQRLPNGRLPAPPHDASGHTWHHSDDVLFRITKLGPAAYPQGHDTDMPAFAGRLSDEQIISVLAFIKSTWPEHILLKQREVGRRRSR